MPPPTLPPSHAPTGAPTFSLPPPTLFPYQSEKKKLRSLAPLLPFQPNAASPPNQNPPHHFPFPPSLPMSTATITYPSSPSFSSSTSSSSSSSSSSPLAALGLGNAIAIALGLLVLLSTLLLAFYVCRRRSTHHHPPPLPPHHHHQHNVVLPSIIFVAEEGDDDEGGGGGGGGSHSPVPGLDPAAINSYPKFPFSRSKLGDEEGGVCSICLCEYREGEMLRMMPDCRHYFHLMCVDAWLRLNASCPVCRTSPMPTPLSTPLSELVPLSQFPADRRRHR